MSNQTGGLPDSNLNIRFEPLPAQQPKIKILENGLIQLPNGKMFKVTMSTKDKISTLNEQHSGLTRQIVDMLEKIEVEQSFSFGDLSQTKITNEGVVTDQKEQRLNTYRATADFSENYQRIDEFARNLSLYEPPPILSDSPPHINPPGDTPPILGQTPPPPPKLSTKKPLPQAPPKLSTKKPLPQAPPKPPPTLPQASPKPPPTLPQAPLEEFPLDQFPKVPEPPPQDNPPPPPDLPQNQNTNLDADILMQVEREPEPRIEPPIPHPTPPAEHTYSLGFERVNAEKTRLFSAKTFHTMTQGAARPFTRVKKEIVKLWGNIIGQASIHLARRDFDWSNIRWNDVKAAVNQLTNQDIKLVIKEGALQGVALEKSRLPIHRTSNESKELMKNLVDQLVAKGGEVERMHSHAERLQGLSELKEMIDVLKNSKWATRVIRDAGQGVRFRALEDSVTIPLLSLKEMKTVVTDIGIEKTEKSLLSKTKTVLLRKGAKKTTSKEKTEKLLNELERKTMEILLNLTKEKEPLLSDRAKVIEALAQVKEIEAVLAEMGNIPKDLEVLKNRVTTNTATLISELSNKSDQLNESLRWMTEKQILSHLIHPKEELFRERYLQFYRRQMSSKDLFEKLDYLHTEINKGISDPEGNRSNLEATLGMTFPDNMDAEGLKSFLEGMNSTLIKTIDTWSQEVYLNNEEYTKPDVQRPILNILDRELSKSPESQVLNGLKTRITEAPPVAEVSANTIPHSSEESYLNKLMDLQDLSDEERAQLLNELSDDLFNLNAAVFSEIRSTEFVNLAWQADKLMHNAPHVLKAIDLQNKISNFINFNLIGMDLVEKGQPDDHLDKRLEKWKFFIDLQTECIARGDFYTASAISSCFGNASIKLKPTFNALPQNYKDQLKSNDSVVSPEGSFKVMRGLIDKRSEAGQNSIPYIGFYLTDLMNVEENYDKDADGVKKTEGQVESLHTERLMGLGNPIVSLHKTLKDTPLNPLHHNLEDDIFEIYKHAADATETLYGDSKSDLADKFRGLQAQQVHAQASTDKVSDKKKETKRLDEAFTAILLEEAKAINPPVTEMVRLIPQTFINSQKVQGDESEQLQILINKIADSDRIPNIPTIEEVFQKAEEEQIPLTLNTDYLKEQLIKGIQASENPEKNTLLESVKTLSGKEELLSKATEIGITLKENLDSELIAARNELQKQLRIKTTDSMKNLVVSAKGLDKEDRERMSAAIDNYKRYYGY